MKKSELTRGSIALQKRSNAVIRNIAKVAVKRCFEK